MASDGQQHVVVEVAVDVGAVGWCREFDGQVVTERNIDRECLGTKCDVASGEWVRELVDLEAKGALERDLRNVQLDGDFELSSKTTSNTRACWRDDKNTRAVGDSHDVATEIERDLIGSDHDFAGRILLERDVGTEHHAADGDRGTNCFDLEIGARWQGQIDRLGVADRK